MKFKMSAHGFCQATADCQSQTGTTMQSAYGCVQLRKWLKQSLFLLGADARARIPDGKLEVVSLVVYRRHLDRAMIGKLDCVAEQIAQAVTQAYQQQQEAQIAWGQHKVRGLTRNRSLAAWLRNPGAHREAQQAQQQAYQAVNPTLTLLRIDQRNDQGHFAPAGALSLFSIHGTGIAPFTRPYHADVWHWFSEGVSQHWRQRHPDFIHGAAQATHGDNTPAWIPGARGERETRRIGQALSEQALILFDRLETELTTDWQLAVASKELDLLADLGASDEQLCPRAVVGTPVVGAAHGDEVFPLSYTPPFRAGSARKLHVEGCQGHKYWMLSALQRLLPAQTFPHRALVQIIQINDQVLLTLPWEVTYEAGNRLRQSIQDSYQGRHPVQVEVASLANGYLGYAVTPEEYQAQYYEGGHTLYGPNTLPYLQQQSQRLARLLLEQGGIDAIPQQSRFQLRQRDYYQLQPLAAPIVRQWLGEPHYEEGDWQLPSHWVVDLVAEPARALALHQPLLSVYCTGAAGDYRETDDDGNLELRHLEDRDDRGVYRIRWYTEPLAVTGECRLQLHGSASGQPLAVTLPGP